MAKLSSSQRRGRGWTAVALALMLGLLAVIASGWQSALAQANETATPDGSAAAEDLPSLVAPVALYPDPVLALVLQASTQPLQVVQAERFLEKRKKDPKLTPDPEWDKSIVGLLNYPNLIGQMNEYIDWTETVGDAVVDQLDDVQGAIQDIRWGAYNSGILVSNKQQKVVAEEDIIRILPADPKTVSIPKYDPEALLAAIEPPEVVEEELPIPAPEKAAAPAAQPAAPAATSDAPAPAPAAAPAAEAVYAPSPYTGPPMVSYAEPQTSFWESAATFAGGAVVGGLLGYAISDGDDWFDDDDHDEHGGRNINIEDSTVVVGGGRYDRDRVQNELRNRRGTTDRSRSRQQVGDLKAGDWKKGGVAPTRQTAGRGDGAARAAKKKDVRLPNAGTQRQVTEQLRQRNRGTQAARQPKAPQRAKAVGYGKREAAGGVAALQPRSETRRAANRGAQSRQGGGKPRATPASVGGGQRDGGGGLRKARGDGGGMANVGRGDRASRDGDRGRRSRGGDGGRERRR
ncbi:conserved exported hypothetical protein [Candidatus Defluviicoccus seviourii]|uniref:DUF3300 domain-containing protein n=1 Tax=Candidatus Defluviicoccus seviourii TaxID=2565273 RepID=A0A564WFA2_9PROT|nr:conserved exported hypothetical protein [Candidatus Defluviicoccus seviourii]